MAHLYKRDQNCCWESEISDDKIIAILPNDYSSIRVSYMNRYGETQEIICDKIALL